MTCSRLAIAFTASSTMLLAVLCAPALANENSAATQLLPLEARNVSLETNSNLYDDAAADINGTDSGATEQESNSPDITDILPEGLLDSLVDENGEIDLPLGLTIFDTMGDTSVGFGTEF